MYRMWSFWPQFLAAVAWAAKELKWYEHTNRDFPNKCKYLPCGRAEVPVGRREAAIVQRRAGFSRTKIVRDGVRTGSKDKDTLMSTKGKEGGENRIVLRMRQATRHELGHRTGL